MSTLDRRGEELLREKTSRLHRSTDRLFAGLMIFQFAAGIAAALWLSPRTWAGSESRIHLHVWAAVGIGLVINAVPLSFVLLRPGHVVTRHAVAVGQALTSALLIHLSGGRIETHFHVFGSLAFLAFYRDWRVLVTASAVVAADHFVRGIYWPESVFGVLSASPWRPLEHSAWVVFEDVFLIRSCARGRAEMIAVAQRESELERAQETTEAEVLARTADLQYSLEQLAEEIREREAAETERDELTARLIQNQKLEAVGALAAGIAHEINTPTQFVGDNTRFLEDSFRDLLPALERANELVEVVGAGGDAEALRASAAATKQAFANADVDYLQEEVPLALAQSLEGIDRVSRIVRAMKEFSHPGSEGKSMVDLNRAIDSTITVATNEWKYVSTVETDFDPTLPPAPCIPQAFNQVILNLLVNAAHAIESVVGESGEKGVIRIATCFEGEHAVVTIQDSGKGIPESIRSRIFDPFFTTKDVGKGTGQGLSLAHRVIVGEHGGSLDLKSAEGEGAKFEIRLPLVETEGEAEAA